MSARNRAWEIAGSLEILGDRTFVLPVLCNFCTVYVHSFEFSARHLYL